jgi:hypothetical protein
MEASNLTTMATPIPPGHSGGGGKPVQMTPNPFHRISRATLETPLVLVYAAVIVTILTVLYWLLGG